MKIGSNTRYVFLYDAWGNVLTVTGEAKDTIGQNNPLLYRGYVYDRETKLYYLQSRYYDPAMGRFLNADAFASTGQGLLGNNMFAYCNSNPTNYSDTFGLRPVSILERFGDTSVRVPPRRKTSDTTIFPITASIGISGSITIGPYVYGAQIVLVTDSKGISEYQFTYYSTLSSSTLTNCPSVDSMIAQIATYEKTKDILEFSLMGNMSFYNAPDAKNLYNEGYQLGGTIGAGSAIAVDYNIIPNKSDTPYKGITISAGLGSSDVHAVMGSTFRLATSRASVYDLVQSAYNAVWGVY